MKRIVLLISLLMKFVPIWGQTNSAAVKLTDAQRDSVIKKGKLTQADMAKLV